MQKETVLEVITDRIFAKRSNVPFTDTATLGLGVEGGGMRGIVSAGMLLALKDLDILDIFDYYVGISAGSLNLAYVLSGQTTIVTEFYFDQMTDNKNLSIKPTHRGDRLVMDIRNMHNHAKEFMTLDEASIKTNYPDKFRVTVGNITKNDGELISPESAGHRFYEFLWAGATIPYIGGTPWIINNNQYFDGGLYYPDPSYATDELDCTHALILNTNSQEHEIKPQNKFNQYLIKHLDDDYNNFGENYLRKVEEYSNVFSNLPYGETDLNKMRIYRLATEKSTGVSRLTQDKDKLLNGLQSGYQAVLDLFEPGSDSTILPTKR